MRILFTLLIIMSLSFSADALALCVKVSKARLRTGPGTEYPIAWEVFRYMPFEKVGSSVSGDWYAVKDVDGDVLWIYRKLVTEKYDCAVVQADDARVRKGPGTKYSVKENAKKYYSYRVSARKGQWIKVKDELSSSGWIYRNMVWVQ